jgi:2-keto-4-pentenoate hydratase
MNQTAIEAAAAALANARRTGHLLAALPADAQPTNVADAHAIQDATVAALGEKIAGWKVSIADGQANRGAVLGSRLLASPARIPAASMPMLGLEAEIAFRFERDLPPRAASYTQAEIADAVTALAAIEVVDTRFENYTERSPLEKLADFMLNGALVTGTARPDWRGIDLASLRATLSINGHVVVDQTGGHVTRDPIIPAVALVNALREDGIARGRIITTGTYTGFYIAKPGDKVVASFEGFGSVELQFS